MSLGKGMIEKKKKNWTLCCNNNNSNNSSIIDSYTFNGIDMTTNGLEIKVGHMRREVGRSFVVLPWKTLGIEKG